ncbi:MAG: acylphosphatase [Flavobacteriaceae bacterium]|nr:acylphosphatase [Flavobacteriaceae bacterium]
MEKCYNVMVTGKVQDIGLRSLIEDVARLLDLKGFAFNDPDGSVKMVCCGDSGEISNFLKEIRTRGEQKGALIEDIRKEEIPYHIYLPQRFIRLYTDELEDTNRKLDVGIGILKDIKRDTSILPEIKGDTSAIKVGIDTMNAKFDTLNMNFDSFIVEQKEHNQWMKYHLIKMDEHNMRMDEHNKHLEKILEKLDAGK